MKRVLITVLVLSLTALACGFNITLPTPVPLGPEVTDALSAAYPAGSASPSLKIRFGAGKLTVGPGAGEDLLTGAATYNVPDLKPEVKAQGSQVVLQQGNYTVRGIPTVQGVKNEWSLQLGNRPFALEIEAGAYEANYEFGGLPLTDLSIQDGASQVNLAFSEPNPVEMNLFRYETGASTVTLRGLANANFTTMLFESGAGTYRLDFSGTLRRPATVSIESGVSTLTLVIPPGVSAVVKTEGGLTNVTVGAGWAQQDGTYVQEGAGPTLTILVQAGVSQLVITK